MSENVEASAYKRIVERRKDKKVVRIFDGGQWEHVNRLTPLQFFICQTCPEVAAEGDDRLETEMVNVVGLSQRFWDVQNGILAQPFTKIATGKYLTLSQKIKLQL